MYECVNVGHRAGCAECLIVVRVVCVSFLHGRGVARGLHRTGLCQHAFREGETSLRRRRMTGHALPQPLCAARPGSRATCSPLACLGTKAASATFVNPCLADLSGKGFLLYAAQTNARNGGGTLHPRGWYSISPGRPQDPRELYST